MSGFGREDCCYRLYVLGYRRPIPVELLPECQDPSIQGSCYMMSLMSFGANIGRQASSTSVRFRALDTKSLAVLIFPRASSPA